MTDELLDIFDAGLGYSAPPLPKPVYGITDTFRPTQPDEIDRNGYGWPMVKPKAGGKPIGYRRMSTVSDAIGDGDALDLWHQRVMAVGIARDRGLYAMACTLAAVSRDPLNDAKAELNALCEEAQRVGGGMSSSEEGTAVHEMCAMAEQDLLDWSVVPERLEPTIRAYLHETRNLEVVASEVFVVNDELKVAGSLDKLYRLPDGRVVVGDLKTGKWEDRYPNKVMTQVAGYANSYLYQESDGRREVVHPDLDPTLGLLIHLPLDDRIGQAAIYPLDLVKGIDRARACVAANAAPKSSKLKRMEF